MRKLEGLEPEQFFRFFEEISEIPRGSKNTRGVADYLVTFAKERGLLYIRDRYDNVVIKKGAQGASNSAKPVIIQGHTDMVTVAAPGRVKDFLNEGIDLVVEGDIIRADGTTLGADDGVAVAYALAVLDDDKITHPPIEAVFTSDEEIGLIGAGLLDTSVLTGRTFLNIDSEDDGIIFAGCAGGATCELSAEYDPAEATGKIARIELTHLTGGHSGMEIDKGRANANKVLAAVIKELFNIYTDLKLISFYGGEKDNAIATFAEANVLITGEADLDKLKSDFEDFCRAALLPYAKTDPDAEYKLTIETEATDEVNVLPDEAAKNIIELLCGLEDGALTWSKQLDNVVETSSNLGITDIGSKSGKITVSVRSIITKERDKQIDKVKALAGDDFNAELSGVYSAWSYNESSRVRDIILEEYKNVTGKDAEVRVIHAGLECGIFSEKMPDTDFVSFGPQADDIHTYNESMSISSAAAYWEILKNILARLAKE